MTRCISLRYSRLVFELPWVDLLEDEGREFPGDLRGELVLCKSLEGEMCGMGASFIDPRCVARGRPLRGMLSRFFCRVARWCCVVAGVGIEQLSADLSADDNRCMYMIVAQSAL